MQPFPTGLTPCSLHSIAWNGKIWYSELKKYKSEYLNTVHVIVDNKKSLLHLKGISKSFFHGTMHTV